MADRPEVVTVPDEVITLVGRLLIENTLLQARLAQQPPPLKLEDLPADG